MRRSEREQRLAQLAERVLGDARRILTVDLEIALEGREVVPSSAGALASVSGAFDGALIGIDAACAPRARVAAVCARLREGAPLLLVARRGPSVSERARGLITRTPPPRVPLAALTEALLHAGLCTPRVHDALPTLLLVSARVPSPRTPLDAFFADSAVFPQPDDAARR